MQFVVAIAAIWAVTGAAPTGKSWGIPASLAPQRISYNYVPAYYQSPQLARVLSPAPAPIIIPYRPGASSRYHIQDEFGQYNYGYANADGQAKTEIRGIDGSVAGKFSYFDPEGKHIELTYVADKDGFRAAGDHLPKPVELPEDLAEAYEEAKDRINQVRAATAAKRAFRAAKAAALRYSQARVQAYSQQAYPQVFPQTFVQAIPRPIVQTAPQAYTRTYIQPAATRVTYTRPAYVQAAPQVYATVQAVDTSSTEDVDDEDDDGQDAGQVYVVEQQTDDDDDQDDGEYREEDHGHEAGQYKHDSTGDGDDEDDDANNDDGDDGDDDGQTYTGGAVASAAGQVYVSTPTVTAQTVYTGPTFGVTGYTAAQAQPSIGIIRQPVYTAPGYTAAQAQPSIGIIRQPVYTAPAPLPAVAPAPAAYPAVAPAPSAQTVYRQYGYYSAPVPTTTGVVSQSVYPAPSTVSVFRPHVYAAPPQLRAPVSYLRPTYSIPAPAPVHAPASSPVIATKVKSYTATGPVRSLPMIHHTATPGVQSQVIHGTGGISTLSVSAQIPVRSVPVVTPQVSIPVSVHPVAAPTVYKTAGPVAIPAPAPHSKSGYAYTG